jgi:hypothetical protein
MSFIMKCTYLIIFGLISFTSKVNAQNIADSIANKPATVQMIAKHHAFIYSLLQDKGTTDAINYVNQVRSALESENFDSLKMISITVPYSMIVKFYNVLGTIQERLSYQENHDIMSELLPQLNSYPDLLQFINTLDLKNRTETEALRASGINSIMSIHRIN